MSVKEPTPWYVLNCPEIGKAYQEFSKACRHDGVLDAKTKELLMVALASAFRCAHCTKEHLGRARDAGASREEITEAILIAALEAGGTQLAWSREVFEEYLRP